MKWVLVRFALEQIGLYKYLRSGLASACVITRSKRPSFFSTSLLQHTPSLWWFLFSKHGTGMSLLESAPFRAAVQQYWPALPAWAGFKPATSPSRYLSWKSPRPVSHFLLFLLIQSLSARPGYDFPARLSITFTWRVFGRPGMAPRGSVSRSVAWGGGASSKREGFAIGSGRPFEWGYPNNFGTWSSSML